MTVAKHTVMLMAGGTGGHIFPGLAVADYMRERGWVVTWLGNPQGMEGNLVPPHGFTLYPVNFGGLRGKSWRTKIALPFTLLRAFYQSYRALRYVRPHLVLGMGGYITFPGGVMARLLGIPLVLHEQNAVAGLSNRVLARIAHRVLCAFPNTLPNAIYTGNPVRRAFIDAPSPQQRYAGRTGPLRLLVVGGSLGAAVLNDIVPQALALLPPHNRPEVIHQSGAAQLETMRAHYLRLGIKVDARAFIDDMAYAYAQADLVICRAGAMTVAEIAALGVAALFVPYPFAVDDHQTRNAEFLVNARAAMIFQQSQLTAPRLAQYLLDLNRARLIEFAVAAKKQAKLDATAQIAKTCVLLVMPGYQSTNKVAL